MKYVHPYRYKGVRSVTAHGQNIVRAMVEEYCLKCDQFMGQEHDFTECQTLKWENGKIVKKRTCPFEHMGVSLIDPQVNYDVLEDK